MRRLRQLASTLALLAWLAALLPGLAWGQGETALAVRAEEAGSGAPASFQTTQTFDVRVVGSEPEAIVAAVAAAEEGASVPLVTPDERVGGLFVRGELNVLDLKTQPRDYQLGLFDRWWRRVGRQEAFDVGRAEAAFQELLDEAGV